jgi:two-component SAPR family response regulator
MPALKDVKIVVVTAYPRFRESAQFLEADRFLIKPIQPDEVLDAIEALLSE